jgi:hypothetical protein
MNKRALVFCCPEHDQTREAVMSIKAATKGAKRGGLPESLDCRLSSLDRT